MTRLDTFEAIAFELLDNWLNYRNKYSDLPGFQITVRKKGEIVFNKAYGFSNIDKKTPYETGHLGHVASNSKMFTACVALCLHVDGLLNINELACHYLPELKKHKDKRFQEITIRDLMTHRSGIFRDGVDATYWELEQPFLSRKQILKDVMQAKLVFDPNTVSKYSNIGYALLGMVLEAATDKPYIQLIQEMVLDKLPGTKVVPDYKLSKNISYADGHTRPIFDGRRKSIIHPPAHDMAPATGFCANTEGMTQFLHHLYFKDTFLPQHVRRDLLGMNWAIENTTNQFYGYGTAFRIEKEQTLIGHAGGYPGFSSQTVYIKDTDYIIGVIVNTNSEAAQLILQSIADVLKRLKSQLSDQDLKSAVVTQPIINKWGAVAYVICDKKAFSFSLETWQLNNDVSLLEKHKDGQFYFKGETGYGSLGQPLEFIEKNNKIVGHINCGVKSYVEDEFLKQLKKNFLA